jgi:hypothetical protein
MQLLNNEVFLEVKSLCCVLLSVDVLFVTTGKVALENIY